MVAAAILAEWCAQPQHRALVLTDRRELAKQMHQAAFLTMGTLAQLAIDTPAERAIPPHECHISTWQRLSASTLEEGGPLLIVSDECHAESPLWRRHYDKAAARVGLTATPYDENGNSIIGTECWPSLISEYGLIAAIQEGELVQVYINHLPLSSINIDLGNKTDARQADKEAAEIRVHRIAEVIKRSPAPTIAFAKSIVESRAITRVLQQKGVSTARHIDCYEEIDHKQGRAIKDFRDGKIAALCNYRLWERGIDTRNAKSAVICKEMNPVAYLQAMGRITRFCCEGAKEANGGQCQCGARKKTAYLIDTSEKADGLEVAAEAIAGQLSPTQSSNREAKAAILQLLRSGAGVALERNADLERLASSQHELSTSQLLCALDPTDHARPLAAVADLGRRLRLARAEPTRTQDPPQHCDRQTAARLLELAYFRTEKRPSPDELRRRIDQTGAETAIAILERRQREGLAHPAQLLRLEHLGALAETGPDASRERAALRLKRLQERAKLGEQT